MFDETMKTGTIVLIVKYFGSFYVALNLFVKSKYVR